MLIDPRGRDQRNWPQLPPRPEPWRRRHPGLQHRIRGGAGRPHRHRAGHRAGLSDRSLHRRFRAATGLTPNAYVQALRVEKARGRLERTRDPVAQIAHAVGYSDLPAFTRLFRASTGLTSSEYRSRFRSLRPAILRNKAGQSASG
ncbi:MAG: helix-turn-helix transcriptional regulator [Paracoccaceae bacterium]